MTGAAMVSATIVPAIKASVAPNKVKAFKDDFYRSASASVGFNTGSELADMLLPPSKRVGGGFARSTMRLIAGNFGATITSIPRFLSMQVPPSHMAMGLLATVPMVLVDNIIYRSVRSCLRPLALH
jgi:hypothetical protein